MLNIFARASVSRVTDPVGRGCCDAVSRRRRHPRGTAGTVWPPLVHPARPAVRGTLVITFFVLFDLLDGAVARASGSGTRLARLLDASCDRIADGALFAAIAWWCLAAVDGPRRPAPPR